MSVQVYPTQRRYNDPTDQLVTDPLTIHKRKYLSYRSNQRLQAIGNNFVLIGLDAYWVSFSGSVITIYMHGGKVIHDSTLIDAPDDFTLDLDVSDVSYVDTGSGGHLGVFTDFLYTEAPDLDAQTPLAIHFFHLNSDGTVVQPAGWNHDRCRVLLAAVNFYKLGVNVTAANLDVTSLIVNITETLTVSGRDLAHVNMWNVLNYHAEASYLAYLADDYRFDNIFKKEFIFQDLSKR